jgi:putative ABC transport system permease protein
VSILNKWGAGLVITLTIVGSVLLLIVMPGWLMLACLTLLIAWLALTRTGQQAWSVALVGIATIPQRSGPSAVVVVGIAGVVGVFVALLAMGEGFEKTMKETGTDDTVIITQAGAQSEAGSVVAHDMVGVISQAPQLLKDAEGTAIASPELFVVAALRKKSTGLDANAGIRGVGEQVWNLRPHVKIIAGREFKSGLHELIVGKGAHAQFAGTEIGAALTLNSQSWTVVGFFDSGDAHNSEMWGDTDVVASAFRRGSGKTSLVARLTDARAFDAFNAGLASDPRLKVDVQTTRQYYNRQSAGLTKTTRILGVTVGAIMAIGAVFGALNTMYSAVATRAREIATLRAIGFRRVPVIISVMLEIMLLATLGGSLGAAIAWVIFDGLSAATMSANASQFVFAFEVSPLLLWNGFKCALAIGFIGGLFPAVHAARMPVAAGLRET